MPFSVDDFQMPMVRLDALVDRIEALAVHMDDRVGSMEEELLKLRYARRFGAYFRGLAGRLRVVDQSTLADLLDVACDRQHLTEDERDDAMEADLVLTGRRRTDDAEAYLVVEISVGIGLSDVRRARRRAEVIARLGKPAVPVVAGRGINTDAEAEARSYDVWQVLDGSTTPSEPNGSP